ncbi:MAG: tetratricopeptide repeat protein [Planctomycetes bacterium]|nr:tetratricopeptide repeat protein [Planctomycetota bacterium]
MRRIRTPLVLATIAAAIAVVIAVASAQAAPAAPADGPDGPETALRVRLLRDVSSESAGVRESAATRLEVMDGLTAAHVAEALRGATPPGRSALMALAATRGMTELVPEIAAAAAAPDAQAAETAIRALVTLGKDAVAAGRAALEPSIAAGAQDAPVAAKERVARLGHLGALDVQRRVERDVLSRWRRKGGSYRGRYTALLEFGWDAQPVLLAMLLDVPLEDQFIVVGDASDPQLDQVRRVAALRDVAASRRRGYRTFDPLPANIDRDEIFDLAAQALADVADLDVMQDVLEDTHRSLLDADGFGGMRPRRFEKAFAQSIEVILSARGAPERLDARRRMLESAVNSMRQRLSMLDPEIAAIPYQIYTTELSELAGVLHQLGRYDDAAKRFEEIIEIIQKLTDKEPSIQGYNRACALAQGKRYAEALEQLARALDPKISSGNEDLTREWVTEDGDLEPLHADPRWAAIMKKRFGP